MIPYVPKVGETVSISPFFMLIKEVSSAHVAGEVRVSEHETVFVRVPLQACEPFDAVKDAIEADFDERD